MLCANRRRPQGGTASVAARKKEERAKALLFGAAAAAEIDATAAAAAALESLSLFAHSLIPSSFNPFPLTGCEGGPLNLHKKEIQQWLPRRRL